MGRVWWESHKKSKEFFADLDEELNTALSIESYVSDGCNDFNLFFTEPQNIW